MPRRRRPPPAPPAADAAADERALYSRTEDKRIRERDESALMALAQALVQLSDKQLTKLTLPESVEVAVHETRRIRSPSARNRSLRLVRTALRGNEPGTIKQQLEALLDPSHATHLAERWRDRLLQEGDAAVAAFMDEHPTADRQRLRQLVRNVHAAEEAERAGPVRTLTRALRAELG